jgi:protein TonB
MERPSHSIKTLQFHTGPRRVTGMGLSFLIPPLLGLGLMWGFVVETVKPPPDTMLTRPQEEVEQRVPPPPEPNTVKPVVPTVMAPTFDIDVPPAGTPITTIVPQTQTPPVPQPPQPKPNPVPDRAAVSIAATHTSPPYPTIARRLGVEGRVTLRLTVLPDGKVGKAEVVTSSGRRDFDEAAQSWIVQHWTYQPAFRDGVPAASQAMAAVNFTLTNP